MGKRYFLKIEMNKNQAKVDMMIPSDTNSALISSNTQYHKEFRSRGAKAIFGVMFTITLAALITQIVFFCMNERTFDISAAFMSIPVTILIFIVIWGAFYNPIVTDVNASKTANKLEVTY